MAFQLWSLTLPGSSMAACGSAAASERGSTVKAERSSVRAIACRVVMMGISP